MEARLIECDELQATIDLTAVAFGAGPRAPEDYRKQSALNCEPDRTFVVDDGDGLVGTAATFSLALALPGGGSVPLAWVTGVGVSPTHRRRGVLRALLLGGVSWAVLRRAGLIDERTPGAIGRAGAMFRPDR